MIRTFLQEKGVISQEKKKPHTEAPEVLDAVDPMILEQYCLRNHPGPTQEYMPISWTSAVNHPWNEKVVQLLAAEFKAKVEACHYQRMTSLPVLKNQDGGESVAKIIRSKISNRQSTIKTISRKRTQATHLTRPEFEDMVSKESARSLLRSRHTERRNNVGYFGYFGVALEG